MGTWPRPSAMAQRLLHQAGVEFSQGSPCLGSSIPGWASHQPESRYAGPRVRFGRRWSISSPCPYPSWNVCDMRMRLRCISSAGIVLLILVCASYSGRDRRVEMATFAGGCFWCMEPPFDKLKGVTATTSGYIGGTKKKPTYAEVSRGLTGHAEAVRVTYDPEKVTYSKLLEVFWHNIDPTTPNRQFCDVGSQYRRHLLSRRDAAPAGRGVETSAGTDEAFPKSCCRDRTGRRLLSSRGLSPGLLHQEPAGIPRVSLSMRARSALAGALG